MNPTNISLPWPPSDLSPNTRSHWAALARAKKRYRDACFISTREQRIKVPAARLDVALWFVPPDRRSYDSDNLIARMKSGLDGIAQALGIDDAQFVRVSATLSDTPAVGGRVVVTLREHVAQAAPASPEQGPQS